MHCDNCGSEVDEKDVYCGNCGHRIERDVEVIDHTRDKEEFIDVTPDRREYNGEPFGERADKSDDMNHTSGTYRTGGQNGNEFGAAPPPRYKAKLNNSSALISLVCGILSLCGVFTLITAIIGYNMGKKGLQLAATGEYDGENYARAGKICSIIGLVYGILQLLSIVFHVFVFFAAIFTKG